jgi:DNA-binding MarR family transcriptional regulator
MIPSSGGDRILKALSRQRDGQALTWVELNAELPSMTGGDITVRLDKLERAGLIEKERQAGMRGRPWGWSLTDAGRKRVGAPKAKPQPEAGGTVADLVQEIKAEQDAEVARGIVVDPGHHPRLSPTPAWLQDACKQFEKDAEAASTPPDAPLILTLRDDGTLAIVADGGRVHVALTAGQTSQLGRFLKGTAGVWECPF